MALQRDTFRQTHAAAHESNSWVAQTHTRRELARDADLYTVESGRRRFRMGGAVD